MSVILDTPEQIAGARMATLKGALKMECLGMPRRGQSAYAMCKAEYGLKGNKQKVLAQMEILVEETIAKIQENNRQRAYEEEING